MISIASETNSVQIDNIEETKVNQETNSKQEPNVIQKTTQLQMEGLHIAEGTTRGEQSESRQSGAEHPEEETSSTEQGLSKTDPSECSNKYIYPIFAGYSGELYLNLILKMILPYALYRTWSTAVSFQAPGNVCYVGVGKIAEREKPGVRKIQKDLQELEARGLLSRYADWVEVLHKDGTVRGRAVQIKDFSRLYDLAYEYHLWKNAPEYIPAEWEYTDLIKKNKPLVMKLMRFDNYRHILTCQKPGPQAKLTELQQIYHCQLPQEDQNLEASFSRTDDRSANNYLPKQLDKDSPYEESKNPRESIIQENTDSSLHSEGRVFESVEPTTIRNIHNTDQERTDMKEEKTKKIEEEQREQRKEQRASETRQSEVLQQKGKEPEAVEEEIEYNIEDLKNNPMAMIGMLLTLHEQEQQKQQEQTRKNPRHHKTQPKRKHLGTPERLARTIAQMVQQLGGNPTYLQSDITRVTKIYWACTQIYMNFRNAWFLEQLTEIFVQTCKARKVKNRVAYFFKCLEVRLGLTNEELAYIRSTEPLYADGDLKAFVLTLQQSYESSASPLEYQQWIKQTYL
jgi:hypothetical protein